MAFWIHALLLAFLSAVVLAADPAGVYCASTSYIAYNVYVQLKIAANFVTFRVDGAMHWATCGGTSFTLNNDGVITLTPSECMQRLSDEKISGAVPKITYDGAKDTLHMDIDNLSIIGSVALDFSKEACDAVHQEVDIKFIPEHSEL